MVGFALEDYASLKRVTARDMRLSRVLLVVSECYVSSFLPLIRVKDAVT